MELLRKEAEPHARRNWERQKPTLDVLNLSIEDTDAEE
jgi:hypothetical protein